MVTIGIFAALAFTGAPLHVTYLKCSLGSADNTFEVRIAADEENQSATVEIPSTGNVVRKLAVFSADEVSISEDMGVAIMTYRVNRVSLQLTRTLDFGKGKLSVENGQCHVQSQAKRAF